MKIMVKNIALLLAGIILSLLLAETLLYLSGWIYYGFRIHNQPRVQAGGNVIKILCLGDSFTFGMGTDKGSSFPEQLEKKLNSDDTDERRYIVFNRGCPGNTSSKVLKRLEEDLRIYKPNILFVLIGMNDASCIEETNYFRPDGICEEIAGKFDIQLNNMKLYKLFKIAVQKFEIKQWERKLNAIYGSNRLFESLKSSRPGHAEIGPVKQQQAYSQFLLVQERYFNSRNIEINLALTKLQEAIRIMPEEINSRMCLAQVFIHIDKLDLAIDQLGQAMQINPYDKEIWNELWLIYFRQGKLSLAEETLKIYLYLEPSAIPQYLEFLKHGFPDTRYQNAFDSLLQRNLKEIVDIAKRNKTRIILQTYPGKYERQYSLIAEVAQNNNILLVDHNSVFNMLPEEGRNAYFVEDGHCNSKGYAVMADTVYKALSSFFENNRLDY